MPNYLRWIGGGIGWAAGGPLGAMMGFFFGSMLDGVMSGESQVHTGFETDGSRMTQHGDFVFSLLSLSAAIMKSDEKIVRAELDYVKRFLVTQFGIKQAEQQLLILRQIIKQDIDVPAICMQIGRNMDYASRLQLMHLLFGIAMSDGAIHRQETEVLDTIGRYLHLSQADYDSVKAMFIKDKASAYKILEINAEATDEEVKKAYRKMALKYHPDRVGHLGEDVQKAANAKFSELNSAYEEIKKQRGMA